MRAYFYFIVLLSVSTLLLLVPSAVRSQNRTIKTLPVVVTSGYFYNTQDPKDEKEDKKDKKEAEPIRLTLDVPKDAKIFVNGKPITYEKFAILMEFASSAFVTEDIIYRAGKFESIKLRSKE